MNQNLKTRLKYNFRMAKMNDVMLHKIDVTLSNRYNCKTSFEFHNRYRILEVRMKIHMA